MKTLYVVVFIFMLVIAGFFVGRYFYPLQTDLSETTKAAQDDADEASKAADQAAVSARRAADSTRKTSIQAEKSARDASNSAKDASASANQPRNKHD